MTDDHGGEHHTHAREEEPVRLLCCQARVFNQLGFGQDDMEQLEPAPEYDG